MDKLKIITEYKNNEEIIEIFNTLKEVKESCLGWIEVYEDIDNKNYKSEKGIISQSDDLNSINYVMSYFGYSYKSN